MPNRLTLSPTAQAVIEKEASRIAQLGDAWQPTPENLAEVVKAVLAAAKAVQLEKQAEEISRAKEANPPGCPPLEIPPVFERRYRQCQAGELTIGEVLQELNISRNTYYKWVKILRSEGKDVPREKKVRPSQVAKKPVGRPRKNRRPDEVRLLTLLQDAAPDPKSMTLMSKAEIARHMGFSISKTKAMMKDMEEKGLIETHQRTAASGSQLENAYRTTRFGKRLLKRSLEEKQGDE